jgi:dienelactone hydrolase
MAGNPAPLSRKVTILRANLPPLVSSRLPAERDDDPGAWPQNYRLSELQFDYTLPNPYGGAPIARRAHAYLAAPLSVPPGAKLPAVLAVNGHGGSAWKMTNPDDVHYWFGDAFARRGYLILALDVSHRPEDDRRAPYLAAALYGGALDGDDPAHGNGAHPAIKATGSDSDWEEDGERAWDAIRALDYLLSLPNVDASRIVVTGLSMGGTVAALVGALDPRVALSLPSAPSADLGVMLYKGNHPCWRWLHGDVREYLDSSDLLALTAPRPLIVMTGKSDRTYSLLPQPFAGDKQILRRARAAYADDSSRLVHYLHYDGHRFHVGEKNPTHPAEEGVRTPDVTAPESPRSLAWQTDAQTSRKWPSLFDCIAELLRRK